MLSRIIQNRQEKYVFVSHTADLEKKKNGHSEQDFLEE